MSANRFSKDLERKLVDLHSEGHSPLQIANMLSLYQTSVRRVLLRNGCKLRNCSEAQRVVNPGTFNDYSNKDVQYWLGVLATDGCNTRGAIILETIDPEWMEDYRNFVNPKLNIHRSTPKKGSDLYRVSFRCKGESEYLCDTYGLCERKSLTMVWKKDLTWDFVRGVIDGDGSIMSLKNYGLRMSLASGSEIFRDQLYDFFISNGIQVTRRQVQRKLNILYFVECHHKASMEKMYDLLYSDAKYFLQRKKQKYGSLLGKLSM